MKAENVILKCLNNVNCSCHQLFSGEEEKRGGPVKQPGHILLGNRCILEASGYVEVLAV